MSRICAGTLRALRKPKLMNKTGLFVFSAVAGLSLVAAAHTTARADEVTATGYRTERQGIVVGGSIDGGNIGCQTKNGDDCGDGAHPAGGFSLHLGGMVTPNLAILGEIWGMAHTEDNITASQGLATAAIRGWVVPRLWLQAGVGVARSKISYDGGGFMASAQSDTAPAFVLAAGVELLATETFGLDLEIRGGSGFYEGDARVYNAAIGVGASFF